MTISEGKKGCHDIMYTFRAKGMDAGAQKKESPTGKTRGGAKKEKWRGSVRGNGSRCNVRKLPEE